MCSNTFYAVTLHVRICAGGRSAMAVPTATLLSNRRTCNLRIYDLSICDLSILPAAFGCGCVREKGPRMPIFFLGELRDSTSCFTRPRRVLLPDHEPVRKYTRQQYGQDRHHRSFVAAGLLQ